MGRLRHAEALRTGQVNRPSAVKRQGHGAHKLAECPLLRSVSGLPPSSGGWAARRRTRHTSPHEPGTHHHTSAQDRSHLPPMPGLETVTNRLRSAHVCWQQSARAHPDPADRRLLPGTRGLALLHLEKQRDELAVTAILCRVLLGIPPHDVTSLDGHFGAVSFGVNQCRRAVAERAYSSCTCRHSHGLDQPRPPAP